jgi:asparagine synthase (glutamine-hydrolysing)
LIFASEIKAILAYDIKKELDEVSLYTYLQLTYIPSPYSIFKNIRKVKQGTYLKIKKGNVEVKTYYTIPEPHISREISYGEAQKKLVYLLNESVKSRLIADVPLGAFLSGGIDSSIIVAIASKYTDKLNTFSIGYKNEPFFDETHYAKLVAQKFNTNHTAFALSYETLNENLYDTLNYFDEPFGDSSSLALHILSMHTKKHVSVALSGDGADELFAGYYKHAAELRARNPNILTSLLKISSPIFAILPKSRNSHIGNIVRQLNKFTSGLNLSPQERYWYWSSFVCESMVLKTLKDFNVPDEYFTRKNEILQTINKQSKGINDVLYTDTHLVLVNDMLAKVDMMSMANSLEVRTPFLDYNIVNFAFSLPSMYKINHHIKKRILHDAFKNVLPPELYNRPKHGFEVPLLNFMKTELKSLIQQDLLSKNFIKEQNIFKPEAIETLKNRLFNSNNCGDITAKIWTLIVFQYWWKNVFSK